MTYLYLFRQIFSFLGSKASEQYTWRHPVSYLLFLRVWGTVWRTDLVLIDALIITL